MKPVVLVAIVLFSQFLFANPRSAITKDQGESVTFTPDQLKPVLVISNKYLAGLPEDAIYLSDFPPIDHDLQILYSELKYIESESLRVVITINFLEERLLEIPLPEDPEDLFMTLGSLYRYYLKLGEYQKELNDQWNQLQGT